MIIKQQFTIYFIYFIYLEQIGRCIDEEIDHIQSYLPESTKQSLIKIVEETLMRIDRYVIENEIKTLLDNENYQGESFCSSFSN